MPAILQVDPHRVQIGVNALVDAIRLECLAGVRAAIEIDPENIDRVVVGWIDANVGEIKRPGVDAVDACPAFAAVRALEEAAGLKTDFTLFVLNVRKLAAQKAAAEGSEVCGGRLQNDLD